MLTQDQGHSPALGARVALAFPMTAFNPRPASGSASAADSAEFKATGRGATLFSPHPHLVPEDGDTYTIHLQSKFQGQISEPF